jgi:hypothetical protein
MHSIFANTLTALERTFRALESDLPPPVRVPWKTGFYYRYDQKDPKVLVVQKLSRIITGMQAALLLARSGLYQEVGVMCRILDEFGEDVIFISEAVRTGQITELQQQFIDEFFQPEFDNPNPLLSTQKRHRIPRDRIQAAIARFSHHPMNPSDAQSVSRTIAKGYSGYVHGASERILEMYNGKNYCLSGMLGTPRQLEFEASIWEYMHRSLVAVMYACLAFGKQDFLDELYKVRAAYEQAWGRTEWPSPQKMVSDIKRDGGS